jgi:hypothetical protein
VGAETGWRPHPNTSGAGKNVGGSTVNVRYEDWSHIWKFALAYSVYRIWHWQAIWLA